MHSDNFKVHPKNLRMNQMLDSKREIIQNQYKNNAESNQDENSNFESNQLSVDIYYYLKDKSSPSKKLTTAKFKQTDFNEIEPILNVEDDDNFSNAEKIKNILYKAKIMDTNSEKNFDLRNSNPLNTNEKFLFKTTPPRTPEKEQDFNMIELVNHSALANNNIYESPNMIKDSLKINSNCINQPNTIEFNQEKNISNTTFRAGSEVNKNK
jgi:hypothetical protein